MAGRSDRHVQGQAQGPIGNPTIVGVEQFKLVTRDNGVSFSAINNVSIQTYIDAFVQNIPPEHIVSASRISNGRIAIYLNSKESVVRAVNRGLNYEGAFIELTPLVRPTTKLILSNVYPEIPNSVLVENIGSFCKVVSQCRPIPLGLKNKKLTHVMSFRRQVQVLMNPNVTPPDHINFTHSGTNYRVFVSTESARCFNCGEFGHISRSCKKPKSQANIAPPPTTLNKPTTSTDDRPPLGPTPATGVKHTAPPPPPLVGMTASLARDAPPPVEVPQSGPSRPTSPQPSCSSLNPPPSVASSALPPSPSGVKGPQIDAVREGDGGPSPSHKLGSPKPTPPLWSEPPLPRRSFSDVVSKRKQTAATPAEEISNTLTPLKTPSPQRKMQKKSLTPLVNKSPTLTQALDTPTPEPPSTPLSSTEDPAADLTDTDSMTWEDTQSQTDEESIHEETLPLTPGPLSASEIIKFLASVKGRKKPTQIARKYTSNIPGLVKQLKPLKNSPLFKKSMQQRIYKLVNTLDV